MGKRIRSVPGTDKGTRCVASLWCTIAVALLLLTLLPSQANGMPAPPKKSRMNRQGQGKTKPGKADEVACEACKAIAVEAGPKVEPLVKKLGRENAVTEVLDTICESYDHFRTYSQIPPKMQEGCRKVLGSSVEDFEELLYKQTDAKEIWSKVCKERFCAGIPFDQQREGPNVQSVTVDGQVKQTEL